MITPGIDYFLEGDIPTPSSNGVKIRTNPNDQVTVGGPINPGEGDYFTWIPNNGTPLNSWTLQVKKDSDYLQPVIEPTNPGVDDAQTLPNTYNLYITPVSDQSPDVFYITTGASATGLFMTIADQKVGGDVTFEAKKTPDSSKQKWKFSKTTHLVKPFSERPKKKGLFGFLKKKK